VMSWERGGAEGISRSFSNFEYSNT
jgi:hypothetical protein